MKLPFLFIMSIWLLVLSIIVLEKIKKISLQRFLKPLLFKVLWSVSALIFCTLELQQAKKAKVNKIMTNILTPPFINFIKFMVNEAQVLSRHILNP